MPITYSSIVNSAPVLSGLAVDWEHVFEARAEINFIMAAVFWPSCDGFLLLAKC